MRYARAAATLFLCLFGSSGFAAEADVALGARAFRACAACHSVETNRNMIVPTRSGFESASRHSFFEFSIGVLLSST